MKKTLIKNGKIVQNGNFRVGDILIEGERIKKISYDIDIDIDNKDSEIEVIDATDLWVVAGFIDTHTHGCVGCDMNHITPEELDKASYHYASTGVTTVYPTLLTDTKETLSSMLETIARAKPDIKKGARIGGIHLEGPYLNTKFKGAMPEDLIVKPSVEEFLGYQEKAKGEIKILTIAPEMEGAGEFIKALSGDVCISLGHSNANYEQTREAIKNGAKCSTHTFNAMRGIHQREPAILGAVLESDIYSELICDGVHVHEGNIRLMLKAKGWDRVVAVTDSMCAAGLPDGEYALGVNRVTVLNSVATIYATDTLAGSTLQQSEGFKNLLKFTQATIGQVSKLMSENQAKMLGIIEDTGTIDEGKLGDIVIMDDDIDILYTLVGGQVKISR